MKKTLLLLAFTASLVSCIAEMPLQEEPTVKDNVLVEGQTVVSAGIFDVKTYMDSDYKLYWSADDAIQVNGANSTSISIDPDNGSSADFTIGAVVNHPYCAVCPAAAASGYGDLQATVAVGATQNYTAGSFDPSANILLAYAESGNLCFSSAISLLKLTIGGGDDTDAIKSVRIRANDGTAMSGAFTASFGPEGCALLNAEKDFTDITLTSTDAIAQGTPIYVAIPAQTYAEGINIFMIDENDHWCQAVSAKSFTAVPGGVYPTSLKFNRNGEYQGVGIYTASDWMLFTSLADGDASAPSQTPTASTGNGDYSRFQDENGVVNMYADVNVPMIDWSATAVADRSGSITNWSTVFDGHDHTLSSDKWKIAAFQFIFSGGVVKNLKVDTDNFTPRSASAWGGCCLLASVLAGGEINNCVNNADISVATTTHTSMAGICRTVYAGKIIGCTNNGNLTMSQSDASASCNDYAGGICAVLGKSLTDYGLAGPVEITGCTNNGTIGIEQASYKNPMCYVAVGGLVGWLTGGNATNYAVISDCTNNGEVFHRTPTASGALNTSSSVGGLIGIAYTPNKTASSVPAGRTIGYMYGGAALNSGETAAQDGFYFEMDGCTNKGAVTNGHHVHGSVASGNIRWTVNAGGLCGVAIGMKDKHARINACRNYGTVKSGNTKAAVARSFCNTVLGGLIGHAGSVDLDGCVFKGQLGDPTIETYCTGGIFGSILSNSSASNCKVFVGNLYHTNTTSSSFYYYGLGPGMVSKWTRATNALTTYCASCTFTNNLFGGHIKAVTYSSNSAYAADDDISAENVTGFFYNWLDAANATVQAYTLSGTGIWDGQE